MKCLGRTQNLRRCRREAQWFFCHDHRKQPFIWGLGVITVLGLLAGLYQDLWKPLTEKSSVATSSSSKGVAGKSQPIVSEMVRLVPLHYRHEGLASSVINCFSGELYAIPTKDLLAKEIERGITPSWRNSSVSTPHAAAIVGPAEALIAIETDLPASDYVRVTAIKLNVLAVEADRRPMILFGFDQGCVGGEPIDRNPSFTVVLPPRRQEVVLTKARISTPEYREVILRQQSPKHLYLRVSAPHPGWYDLMISISYLYRGQSGEAQLPKPLSLYVPSRQQVRSLFFEVLDSMSRFSASARDSVLDEVLDLANTRVTMLLRNMKDEFGPQGEYLLIHNLGQSINLRGWKLVGNSGLLMTLTGPVLQPGSAVRVWGKPGQDKSFDIYRRDSAISWHEVIRNNTINLIDPEGVVRATIEGLQPTAEIPIFPEAPT